MFWNSTPTIKEESLEELEQRKVLLLEEISFMGLKHDELNSLIANHEDEVKKYESLTDKIKDQEQNLVTLQEEVEVCKNERDFLKEEIKFYSVTINDKIEMEKEVEKYKDMVKSMQRDIVGFEAYQKDIKEKMEHSITSFTRQLQALKINIDKVLETL